MGLDATPRPELIKTEQVPVGELKVGDGILHDETKYEVVRNIGVQGQDEHKIEVETEGVPGTSFLTFEKDEMVQRIIQRR